MHPSRVQRGKTIELTDLPNVGPAMARDLALLGIRSPEDLTHRDPWALYAWLCERSGVRQDPCVLDTLMSITDYMAGHAPQPWWAYTSERKRRYGGLLGAGHMS